MNHLFRIFLFLVFSAPLTLFAQAPAVQIQLSLPNNPTPTTTQDVLDQLDKPVVFVTNTSLTTQDIMFYAKFQLNGADFLIIDPFARKPTQPLSLQPGESRSLSLTQFTSFFGDYTVDDIKLGNLNLTDFLQNQFLPEGAYSICVQAFDFNTSLPLSGAAPMGCGNLFVYTPDPPIITTPYDGMQVNLLSGIQNLNINWLPVNMPGQKVTYNLKMVKVPVGVNPFDAIESDAFIWLERTGLNTNFFLYDNTQPLLDPETQYAIQITAKPQFASTVLKNDGKSDIVTINTLKTSFLAPTLISPINRGSFSYQNKGTYTFNWQNLDALPAQTKYTLQVAEVLTGQTANQALATNTPIVNRTNIMGTMYAHTGKTNPLLPGKTYAARVKAYDPFNQAEFANNGWSQPHTFIVAYPTLEAPILTEPTKQLVVSYPMDYEFNWTHDLPVPIANMRYKLMLYKNPASTKKSALKRLAPDYTKTDISETNVKISGSDYYFSPNETYVIRLEAYGSKTNFTFEDEGLSNTITLTTTGTNTTFACNGTCSISEPKGRARTSFTNNAVVKIGQFDVLLKAITLNGDAYNGDAEIVPNSFFNSPIAVTLYDVKFNASGQAIEGYAKAKISANANIPSNWKGEESAMTLFGDAGETATRFNDYGNSLEAVGATAQSLPLDFGGVYITNLRLTPTSAESNLVNFYEIPNMLTGNNQTLVFGKKNVCISPGGPAISASNAYLSLLRTATINENEKYNLTLQHNLPQAPKGGTVRYFSCDGAEDIQAVGYVSLKDDALEKNGVNFNQVALNARFVTTFSNWLNWMADVQFITNVNEFNAAGAAPLFNHKKLSSYKFEAVKAIFDHSFSQNPAGYSAGTSVATASSQSIKNLSQQNNSPKGNAVNLNNTINTNLGVNTNANTPRVSNENLWQGVYFEQLNLLVPEYISPQGQNTASKIRLSNFAYDYTGFNGQIDQELSEIDRVYSNIEDWAFTLKKVELSISGNTVDASNLGGELYIPLFQDYIDVNFEYDWDGSQTTVLLTYNGLNNQQKRLTALYADFYVGANTRIEQSLSADKQHMFIKLRLAGILNFDENISIIGNNALNNIVVNNLTYNNYGVSRNENQANFFDNGAYFTIYGTQKIAGYEANITRISLQNTNDLDMNGIGAIFKIEYDFELDALLGAGIQAHSALSIGMLPEGSPITRFTSYSPRIESFPLNNVQIGGTTVNGTMEYEVTSAHVGFSGNFTSNLMGASVDLVGKAGNYKGTKYWGFTADFTSSVPIPIFAGLSCQAIGGAMYYNMTKAAQIPRGGSINNLAFFPPTEANYRTINTFGFAFGTTLMASQGSLFNGRFLMEVDLANSALNNVRFSGKAHFYDDNYDPTYWLSNTEPTPGAAFKLNGEINLNWPRKTFSGQFGYNTNLHNGVLTGTGNDNIAFYFSPSNWYLNFGERSAPVGVTLNLGVFTQTSLSYYQASGNFSSLSSSLQRIEFGVKTRWTGSTPSIWVPVTRRDRARINGSVEIDVNGGFGIGTTQCSNHDPNDFMAYLSAGISTSLSLQYKESCRSWVFFFNEKHCGKYHSKGSIGTSVNADLYAPSPSGLRLGFSMRIPGICTINPGLTLGESCE